MSVIDNLQVLITADARGIDSVLKRTLQTVTGTVNQINKQEVDWTSIFTRSVSPAVIGAVASVFAFAISNAIQFQSALNQIGTAAGENAGQIGQLGQAALGLSNQVPSSAIDLANAMAQLSAIFPNLNDQQAVAQAMAQLTAAGFGNLNDIVAATLPLFKQWGVTTQDQAISVLTDLMHGAEAAKESIPSLIGQFIQFTPALVASGATLNDFNKILSVFSAEVKDLGVQDAQAQFQALTASLTSITGPMELLLGKSRQGIIQSFLGDGGLTLLTETADKLKSLGGLAQTLGTAFGFTGDQVNRFVADASKMHSQVAPDAALIATNLQTIKQASDQAQGSVGNLRLLWNHFLNDMTQLGQLFLPLINGFAGVVNSWLGDIGKFIKGMGDGLGQIIFDIQQGKIGQAILDTIKSGWSLAQIFLKASPLGFLFNYGNLYDILGKVVTAIQSAMAGVLNKINSDVAGIVSKVTSQISGITNQVSNSVSKLQSVSNSVYNNVTSSASKLSSALQGKYTSSNPQQEAIAENLYNSGLGFTNPMISKIESQASSNNLLQQLLNALSQNISGSSTTFAQLKNTFNISTSAGHTYSTAQDIAKQLYQQFQGVQ